MRSDDALGGLDDDHAPGADRPGPTDLFEFVLAEMLSETLDLMDLLDGLSNRLKADADQWATDAPTCRQTTRSSALRLASRLAAVGGWILAHQRRRDPAARGRSVEAGSAELAVAERHARRRDVLAQAARGPLDATRVPGELLAFSDRIDILVARALRIDGQLAEPLRDAAPFTALRAALAPTPPPALALTR